MFIVLFGAPGVGKGTQAEVLSEKLNLAHFSTGDAFRAAIKNETEVGLLAKQYVDDGKLVPDEVVTRVVAEALSDEKFANGALLDGYPRTKTQAESLDELLESKGSSISAVVNISVEREAIIERLLARGRKDDTQEIIANRLDVYLSETEPVLHYYSNKNGLLREVDGNKSISEVSDAILTALK